MTFISQVSLFVYAPISSCTAVSSLLINVFDLYRSSVVSFFLILCFMSVTITTRGCPSLVTMIFKYFLSRFDICVGLVDWWRRTRGIVTGETFDFELFGDICGDGALCQWPFHFKCTIVIAYERIYNEIQHTLHNNIRFD